MVRKYSVDWIGGSVLDWKYFKADLFVLRFEQILDTFPKQTLFALVIDDQQGDDDSNGDEKEFEHGVNSSSITSYLSFEFWVFQIFQIN